MFVPPKPTSPIEFRAFIDFLNSGIDIGEERGLLECVPWLQGLAANDEFLPDSINALLAGIEHSQGANKHVSSTFLLAHSQSYIVRLNIWFAKDQIKATADNLFDYDQLHDHNFSFLTVGIAGPGYKTETYVYDRPSIQVGDHVELGNKEEYRLAKGAVMHYRASRDVHKQHRPPMLSVSLNLISTRVSKRPQVLFDVDGRICRLVFPQSTADPAVDLSTALGPKWKKRLLQGGE